MNGNDIINIHKILSYRKIKMDYCEGGDVNPIDLECKTTEELQKIVDDYNNNIVFNKTKEIKELVDKLFELDSEANTIIFSQSYKDSYYHFELFEINSFNIQPIKIDKHNSWCKTLNEYAIIDACDDVDTLHDLIFDNGIIDDFTQIFDYDDSVNDTWLGTLGITKDYKIIKFVCHEDSNTMTDEYENGPKIIKEL